MSTYQYLCKDCGHTFERSASIREHAKHPARPRCPRCRSHHVTQRPSSFQPVTHSKA